MEQKKIESILKKDWLNKSNDELAKLIGKSESQLRRIARAMGLPPKNGGGSNKKTYKETKPEELKDLIFKFLLNKKSHFTYEDLSNKFDVSIGKIKDAIAALEKEDKNFHFHDDGVEIKDVVENTSPASKIDTRHLVGKRIKFGFVTDNHLGSKYERLDVLNALYDRFAKEGVTTVYNAGNIIDGEARFNKFDIHKHGMQAQCDYFANVYPQRDSITTFFITGDDHEGWYVQREGVNIGKFMENCAHQKGRDDLVYLGHMEHDIVLKAKNGQAIIRIVHPGGGSSYAISYTSQKLVESYAPGEKPQILLMGHYHKMEYNFIRGIYVVQGGCTMDQSPFMRKKRLDAHVGGWICEYQQGDNGIIQSFKAEWIPFYDKNFYNESDVWKYHY